MSRRPSSYEELYQGFRWAIPPRFNMARAVCERHALQDPDRLALVYVASGKEHRYSFGQIWNLSGQLANVLRHHGVERGDRVAILLPQCPETAYAHVACFRLGAVSLPLFTLFGPEAIGHRLRDSGASCLLTDTANLPKLATLRGELPELRCVVLTDGAGADVDLRSALAQSSARFETVDTAAEDPAFLIYTSGTTGLSKGALHAHRSLLGHMPGFDMPQDFPGQGGQPGAFGWTPADWAWIGGLMDLLMPCWFHGIPVLAFRARKFDPDEAMTMLAKYQITNTFIPPTALRLMRRARVPADLRLRAIFTGGESLGEELLAWGREDLGLTLNEGYGQTEFNLAVANCASLMPVKAGSMGRAVPGHRVAIIDDAGEALPAGREGNIVFETPDPVSMLAYWRNPDATREKHCGRWMLSGDRGIMDEEGYFWFRGRADDVITSGGYRIGPSEIEDCLLGHPAVRNAAAIGVPDPVRTEVIKAVIVLESGVAPTSDLEEELRNRVRERLSQHEYPRLIEFVEELPLTETGKIRRNVLRQRELDKARSRTQGD